MQIMFYFTFLVQTSYQYKKEISSFTQTEREGGTYFYI